MMLDLCEGLGEGQAKPEPLGPRAVLLQAAAVPTEAALLAGVARVIDQAPLRFMRTPGGYLMSVAMTNCGQAGWVTDQSEYRYDAVEPLSGRPWPAMPAAFSELACSAAA